MMLHRFQLHKCQKMRQLLLFSYLLEKISLSRGGLGHLPPRWQRDIIGNLVRGLTQMLGRSWGQARQGATRNGSQLQRGWRRVRTDMVGCESPATPSISASLCGRMKQSWINGQYLEIIPSLLLYLCLICLSTNINIYFKSEKKMSHCTKIYEE